MDDTRSRPRSRRVASIGLAIVSAVCLAAGLTGVWAQQTVYDAQGMSRRAVHVLDSSAVRHELAVQLTDQLVKSGNREIIAFRPAAQLTVETIIETDAFKSLFASALRKTHAALLANTGTAGLDLSDTLGFLATGLQLKQASDTSDVGATGGPIASTIEKVADLPMWGWRDLLAEVALGLLLLGLLAALASIWVAWDRRLGVVRVGLAVSGAGVLINLLMWGAARIAQTTVSDPALARAIHDAVWEATSDLRASGSALAVMGMVVAAAASPSERFSPARLRASIVSVYERMRASRAGTLLLASIIGLLGLVTISNVRLAADVVVFFGGLALVFVATRLVISVATSRTTTTVTSRQRWAGWSVAVVAVVIAAVTFSVVSVRSARAQAEASYTRLCLGREDRCDRRLDEVTLAGAHNAMSSPAYPGWLFGEQVESIGGQLNSGIRALLIDAHYGKQSSVTVPGTGVNLVVTDIASEFAVPGAELPDPAVKARAEELAKNASGTGGASDVYLCHNYCELGAVKMVDEMVAVRQFLEANPGEVVVIIVQDAVSAADIESVFDEAGLLPHVATLDRSRPMPTVGELVDADTRLVVFAERGEDDAPAWYSHAYDWFQETGYTFGEIDEFDCDPNRGDTTRPLFLVNHWVGRSPPDPGVAKKANAREVLEARVAECLQARGITPNIIATDFATSGDVVATAARLTDDR